MPAVLALPMFWGAVSAAAAGGAGIYAANKSASASEDAARYGASANQTQLDYLKQKDAQDRADKDRVDAQNRADAERTQQLNYDQWATRERQLAPFRAGGLEAHNTLYAALGLPAGDASAFQPKPYPGLDSLGKPAGGATAPAGDAAVGETPKTLADALTSANQIAYGGQQKHADPSYWQALWDKDPTYAYKRMLGWQAGGADAPTSGPYAGGQSAAPSRPTAPAAPAGLNTLAATNYTTPAAYAAPQVTDGDTLFALAQRIGRPQYAAVR